MRPRWAVQLLTLRGAELWLDATWVMVVPFAAWSLAVGFFPEQYPVFGVVLDWLMGLAGAAGLCVAVLIHETVHVLVQQRKAKTRCTWIVHVVGGVPCGGHTDGWAIAAGPTASLILAVLTFWGALNAGRFSRPLEAQLGYLAIVNALLAVLHAIPAWPFDAGRLVACALPRLGVANVLAVRIVQALGALVALALIVVGGWQAIVVGSRLIGVWIALVGALVAWALATSHEGSAAR